MPFAARVSSGIGSGGWEHWGVGLGWEHWVGLGWEHGGGVSSGIGSGGWEHGGLG